MTVFLQHVNFSEVLGGLVQPHTSLDQMGGDTMESHAFMPS